MPYEARPHTVIYYTDQKGHDPFVEWLESLSIPFQDRVLRRLQRIQLGNFGDHKRITESILELRLHFGKGYRIYYVEDSDTIVDCFAVATKIPSLRTSRGRKYTWKIS